MARAPQRPPPTARKDAPWTRTRRTVSRSNRLFTVGPRFAFASEIASGQLNVVELAVPFRHSIGLHLNRLAYPLPAVAKVLDIIRQAFGKMQPGAIGR